MPNKKSAIKRMRRDKKKNEKNQAVLSELHTRFKKLVVLSESKGQGLGDEARFLISKLDKAVSQGVVPHGRADRKKSRIAKLIAKK